MFISVAIDNYQRILVNTPDFAILRYLPNGMPDLSFGENGKLSTSFGDNIPYSYARSEQIVLQPDSKIINTGFFDSGDGLQEFALARFKNAEALKAVTQADISVKTDAISFYPNPVTSVLNIKSLNANSKYEIRIVDAKGNVVAAKQIDHTNLYSWNVQNLSNGLYYHNISCGNLVTTKKFIKQ